MRRDIASARASKGSFKEAASEPVELKSIVDRMMIIHLDRDKRKTRAQGFISRTLLVIPKNTLVIQCVTQKTSCVTWVVS